MLVKKLEKTLQSLLPSGKETVAVACSGGSDSMALTLAANGWAKKNKCAIIALTVDHGLREESAKEARQVGKWLKQLNISHAVLKWQGRKPAGNLQENARKARYRLLAEYCKQQGISYLLVAHTLEDQAETFLLRLKRGSGVDGLSCMSPSTPMYGITIVRPLLDTSKTALLAYLTAEKQDYVSDPSNENTAYDRVKIRKLLPRLEEVGISSERLAKTAATMARAREHLKNETESFLKAHCRIFNEGYAVLESLPESGELALRVLARLLIIIGGHEIPLRLESLERLYAAIQHPDFRGATVAGCKLQVAKGILIYREPAAVADPVSIKKCTVWDRFEITMQSATRNLQLGALTQAGWLSLAKTHPIKNPYPDKKILYTLPALRDKKGIVAVPHLGIHVPGTQCKATLIQR